MSYKKKALTGVFWSSIQSFGTQSVSFVISIVLARLLLPEEFGLIAMITVFMSIGNVLLSAGLGQSLIRTNVPTEEDYSTVFFFNLICSLIVYGIIYFLADRIAAFYSQPLLVDILRWYSIVVVINAFSMVQITRLTKQIDFKTQMKASFPATILSGILGVILAFRTPRWIGRHVPLKYSKNNRITTFCSLVQFLQILQFYWRMEILRRF